VDNDIQQHINDLPRQGAGVSPPERSDEPRTSELDQQLKAAASESALAKQQGIKGDNGHA
jgi:hypothetical protein